MNNSMKIAHFVHRYRPTIGGSEQYMIDLSERLAKRGHYVTVYTSRAISSDTWTNALPPRETINGVHVKRFGSISRTKIVWDILQYGYTNYPKRKDFMTQLAIFLGNGPISLSWYLSQYLDREKYDIVHTTALPYSHIYYAFNFARRKGIPFVITPFIHTEQKNIFEVKYFFDILRNADAVIAATDYERKYLESHGIDGNKLYTVGLGVDFMELGEYGKTPFKPSIGLKEDEGYILFLGRKEYYKGIDVLIKAFNLIKNDYPRLHLLLIGPRTPYSEKLMADVTDKERIIEMDAVTDAEKNDALRLADIVVLPSTYESFGIVFIEAWANHKPVIGARSGAIVDVIRDKENGLLFTPGDDRDLAEKLKMLLNDKALRDFMGDNGYRMVKEKYTKDAIADKLEELYLSLGRK
ncbi:glycosyltransferase family 4 protein [Methanocella conradii]|uniref:glycosyltransferase family 4 protein n=1 Tax=Methanocella conradii TaxID=1175444 RepID=UPI00318464D2